jgi:hypothetical protein
MNRFNPLSRLARRVGLERGRALANADPHPARLAQDRYEQRRAILERHERFNGPALEFGSGDGA